MRKSALAISLALVFSATAAHAATADWKSATDSGGLTYKIHVPSTFSKPVADKRALMLVMTGCTQENTAVTDSSTSAANLETAAKNWGMVMVAPAKNSSTQAGFSCWGYWESAKASASIKAVRTLVQNLLKDASLNIDPNQVYITGLSSGATISVAAACGSPDLFAGVAPSAGPTLTSGSSCAISSFCSVSQATFTQQCNAYASANGVDKNLFKTQIAGVAYGTKDTTVSTSYGAQNSDLFAGFYKSYTAQTYSKGGTATLTGGKGASEWLWSSADTSKKRVSLVAFNEVPHAWSAGEGATGTSYVSKLSINYADYLGKFFTENNLRVETVPADVVNDLACTVTKDSVNLTWKAPKNGADAYIAKNMTAGANVETTALSMQFKPLTTSKAYTFTVAAKRAGTVYEEAKPIVCTPAPVAAPTELVATPAAKTVALSWKGAGVKYNVKRNAALIASPTAASYADSGLTPETDYNYCVTTVDQNGDESAATCVTTKTKPEVSYTTTSSATCSAHYVAKRLNLNQYLACGGKIGYINSVMLYGCGSPTVWTNKADCSALAF
ncbi:MAG: Poly(3-hydroxybutyrate) depolymerase [Proteobacteria bacterium]|nr:Poly(3-hydroxybutyrate) depolymerase [Pseudomonadota bacterium]